MKENNFKVLSTEYYR